jgi:hypothetical protein
MPWEIKAICAIVSGYAFAYMFTGVALRWSKRQDLAELQKHLEDLRGGR